jgi:D-hydroxyproline dehydrogenase subunit gamma
MVEVSGSTVSIFLDDERIEARTGETVAGALLRHGITTFGSHPVEARNCAPYCMMGICHECAMEIDGQPNRQSCLTPVREGMKIVRPAGVERGDV